MLDGNEAPGRDAGRTRTGASRLFEFAGGCPGGQQCAAGRPTGNSRAANRHTRFDTSTVDTVTLDAGNPFTNTGSRACDLQGFPGVSYVAGETAALFVPLNGTGCTGTPRQLTVRTITASR